MDEDLKLYIPLGVKPEAELFTGFGKKQLFQSIVGSLVMGGIAALAWLFTGNVTTTVILALAGIFGSVMMTTKDQSNLSVVDQVQNLIRFLRGQKIYPYRYGDLEGLWSNGQIAVLKKALSAAAKSGVGLLEATEVVEPNPISPNESTSYSNLYHCDRDGVYLYIDAVSGQLTDAIGKNEG